MKANRKFVEGNEEGVSAVIGVILMVAITVAIAATVYVYVSGMIGGGSERTPSIAFMRDNAHDKIYVTSSDTGIAWDDIYIKTDTAGADINGTEVGVNWTVANPTLISTTNVAAGDEFVVSDATGDVKITLRYNPTNSLIGNWEINV
ncbi:MAG: type IV pilin N-terminal domain-containing protein [Candidatus Thermoplasmatota archaeon]|nr:type IV pilin N-terminal domain-containing protein [Candidatus Thermoplasmatota archaeon]